MNDLPAPPWHLPGLPAAEDGAEDEAAGRGADAEAWNRAETAAGTSFRTPRLDARAAESLAAGVRRQALRARRAYDLEQVIEAVSAAALRLADPDSSRGRTAAALLAAELGWPREAARDTLQRMARGWTADALRGLVASELGDPGVLDGFRPATAPRMRRAAGPPVLLQVQAGNVPGVGVTGMIRGLLVRSGLIVRPSRAEPGLAPLFARSLTDLAPDLGRSAAVCWWPREDEIPWSQLVKASGKVVLYGGEEAVREVRARLPVETDLLPYGPKLGLAVLLPDADPEAAARGLARDVCAYEQRGCVSPRILLTPPELRRPAAREAERALCEWVKEHSVAPLGAGQAAALRQLRAGIEFGDGKSGPRLVGDPDELRWTVLEGGDPALRAEALPRVLRVQAVEGVDEVRRLLFSLEGRVQAVGYAGREGLDELAESASASGVARLCPLGTTAWPPADWRHDGRHQLLPLLRWTDWELPEGESAAEPDRG